jgi:tetratricopeptide (TPR) repeat protein
MATEESAPDGATAPGQDVPGEETPATKDAPGGETPASKGAAAGEAPPGPESSAGEETTARFQTSAGGETTAESEAPESEAPESEAPAGGETAAPAADAEAEAEPEAEASAEPQAPADERTAPELAAAGAEALTEAAFVTGDFGRARELLEKARDAADAAGDQETKAFATERLGSLAHNENITKLITGGEVPAADAEAEEKLFRQSLALSQEVGDQAGTARSVFGVGLVFQVLRNDWPTAMSYYWQALDLSAALVASGDLNARSEIHRHLGFYYHYEAETPGEAVRHLQLSLDIREEIGDPRLLPSALVALGEAELAVGNNERAVDLLTRAVAEARAAELLQHRVEDAERALREAQAAGTPAAGDGDSPAADTPAGEG